MRLSIVVIIFVVAVVTDLARAKDREVRSHLSQWPSGTYGLPQPKTGCPSRFEDGTRYHDTEDNSPSNHWYPKHNFHLAGHISRANMEQKFCMKTFASAKKSPWPHGNYCIFKKGHCPSGFMVAYIRWDDEDDNNNNGPKHPGSLPDGHYDRNTKIKYCCRRDGYAYVNTAINLPTNHDFVLLKAKGYPCQLVSGMNVQKESFYWDNEDDGPHDSEYGYTGLPHVDVEQTGNNLKVYYCYYYK